MLIIGPSGSGKTNALLNSILQDDDNFIDKTNLYTKDILYAFIEYSNTMDDIYDDIDDYNPKRKRKVLIVFDDMIADI